MKNSSNFCCICIEISEDLESVNQEDEQNIKYSDKLCLCEPNQNWDDKTFNLCKPCIEKLNNAFDFIEACRKSEVLRREKLQQIQEEISQKKAEILELSECNVCKKSFKKKRFLKLHMTRMHINKGNVKSKIKVEEKENNQKIDVKVVDEANAENVKSEKKDIVKGLNCFESDNNADLIENVTDTYSSGDEDIKPRKKKGLKRKDPLNCEYCGKLFNRRQHWSAHIRANHTFEKPYKCNLCNASFINSHSLLVHTRNHNNEKPYVCSTCGKSFVCSGDLYHHSKIHLNKREYQCNYCDKRFNTTSILRTHKIVKHTEPKDWKYVCTICNRRFPINSGLAIHMKRHSGIRDFSCHICDKKFFNKSEVSKHVLSHSNQRRYKCAYCGEKEYKNKEGLRKHLKIVHDMGNWKAPKLEKKFLCPMCPKIFTFNNKLQRHILTHTGEKPFKCEYCEKKFIDNYYRRVHLKKDHNVDSEDAKYFA